MASEAAAAEDNPIQLNIQKIYIKDVSFESPNSPHTFTGEWSPQTQLNLRSTHRGVADDTHEVLLTVTVHAQHDDKTVFLIEWQQAGLFTITGLAGEDLDTALGSFCPNVLYPFAREGIASTIQRGGFPEFVLQPIDFDSLYRQSKIEQQKQAGNGSTADA